MFREKEPPDQNINEKKKRSRKIFRRPYKASIPTTFTKNFPFSSPLPVPSLRHLIKTKKTRTELSKANSSFVSMESFPSWRRQQWIWKELHLRTLWMLCASLRTFGVFMKPANGHPPKLRQWSPCAEDAAIRCNNAQSARTTGQYGHSESWKTHESPPLITYYEFTDS